MNLSQIIKSFKNQHILVIGDIILDKYILGKVNRISTEAPVPVVEVINEIFLLGGGANVASNIISLGAKATVAGVIGKGLTGKILRTLLEEKNINTEGLIEGNRPTTIKTRVIAHSQQIIRFDKEDKKILEGKTLETLLSFIKKNIRNYSAIIISDYNKGVVSRRLMNETIKLAKHYKIFIAVDPKVGHFHFYKDVSLITPNISEASQGSGVVIKDEKNLLRAALKLMNRLNINSLLITKGEDGMSLFERIKETKKFKTTHIPTFAKKVFDVTGAGDTVVAVFTLAKSAGASLEQSATISNCAAGIVVEQLGTATVTQEQLLESINLMIHSQQQV